MADTRLVAGGSFPQNSFDSVSLGTGFLNSNTATTEAYRQVVFRTAGTLSNFYVNVSASSTVGTETPHVNKNSSNGNETVSIPNSTTGVFEDLVNTDSVSAGDLFDYEFHTPGGTLTIAVVGNTFAASVNTVCRLVCGDATNPSFNTANGSYFNPIAGNIRDATSITEAKTKVRIRKAGIIKNMFVNFPTNGGGDISTLKSRKNGANGNLAISVGAFATGISEDTSNSDSVSPGDDINYLFTAGSSPSNNISEFSVEYSSSNQDAPCINADGSPPTVSTGVTTYYTLGGGITTSTTEANTQISARDLFVFSELTINVLTNGITNASTVTLRANASNTSLTVSIPGNGTTGVISDSNASDDYTAAATDLMNYRLVTAGTGTTLSLGLISVWTNLTPVVPATPGPPQNFVNIRPRALNWQLKSYGNLHPVFGQTDV